MISLFSSKKKLKNRYAPVADGTLHSQMSSVPASLEKISMVSILGAGRAVWF